MTIDEAIEILESFDKDVVRWTPGAFRDALQLGSEALKLIRQHPIIRFFRDEELLPGETEEEEEGD